MKEASSRRRAYRLGHLAEWLAALALVLKGYRILAVRLRNKAGEIDIVARRGDLVAIVEVKARRSLAEAMDAVTSTAQWRIESAADLWLVHQPDHARLSLRFDIVAVLPWRLPVHIENAFQGRNRY